MLEKYMKNKTVMSITSIAIGLVLMIWGGSFVAEMIRVVGYLLIAAGAVYLVLYFRDNRKNETQLGYAILAAGAGVLLVLFCKALVVAFPIIAGVLMILNGGTALLQSLKDQTVPLYSKLLSALVIVLGILLIIHPGAIANAIVICVGAGFVINGISGLTSGRAA